MRRFVCQMCRSAPVFKCWPGTARLQPVYLGARFFSIRQYEPGFLIAFSGGIFAPAQGQMPVHFGTLLDGQRIILHVAVNMRGFQYHHHRH
jgi:hypothetical protein